MEHTDRLLRLQHLIGDARKGIPALVPIGRSTIFTWVKTGRFPAPKLRVGRATFWAESDIREWVETNSRPQAMATGR